MTNWDFRHINDQRARLVQNSVKLSTYEEQYHFPRRRARVNPWLCVAVILLCLWGLKVLVFG